MAQLCKYTPDIDVTLAYSVRVWAVGCLVSVTHLCNVFVCAIQVETSLVLVGMTIFLITVFILAHHILPL